MTTTYILAAGQGTRMRPLTLCKPKCLVRVDGSTLIMHIVNWLADAAIDRVVITIPTRFEAQLRDEIGSAPHRLTIKISADDVADGTLSSLRRAILRHPTKGEALVWLGDVIGHVDIDALHQVRARNGVAMAVAVHERMDYQHSGVVDLDQEYVVRLREKPGDLGPGPRPVWAGVLCLASPTLGDTGGSDVARNLIAPAARGRAVVAHPLAHDEFALGIDMHADIAAAQAALRHTRRSRLCG